MQRDELQYYIIFYHLYINVLTISEKNREYLKLGKIFYETVRAMGENSLVP